jgi:predicted MFS family arabinose efflux permease
LNFSVPWRSFVVLCVQNCFLVPPSPIRSMPPLFFASLVGIQQIVCWGTLTNAAAVLAPGMAQASGISIASVMMAYGIGLLTNAIAAPVLTRWVLRIGAFRPGLLGLALLMAACILHSQATHWAVMVAGFMLAGLAMALTQYDFAFLAVKLYMPGQARRVITAITFYGALASTIMWPVALALSARIGMPMAWIALGLISVLFSLPAVLIAYRQPMTPNHEPTQTHSDAQVQAVSTASAPWVLMGLIGFTLINTGLVANLPSVITSMLIPSSQIAWILSLFGIGQLAARAMDFVAGRWLSTRATVMASSLSVIVALCLMTLTQSDTTAAAAFVFLLGASNGFGTIARGVLPQQLFRGEAFARLSSQLASFGALGRAFMPMLVAQALALRGGLDVLSIIYCIMAMLCGWMLWQQIRAGSE